MAGIKTHTLSTLTWQQATIGIIAANIALCLGVNLSLGLWGQQAALWFALPSATTELLNHPWTPLTFMFTQWSPLHLLLNMLWLALWVRLTQPRGKTIITTYIFGGMACAVTYVACAQCLPHPGTCLTGASASVCAIIPATALGQWRTPVHIPLLGRATVGTCAIIAILIVLLYNPSNPTSTLAHAAGTVAGLATSLATIRKPRPQRQTETDQQALDRLLAKVSTSGYNSLSKAQRKQLFIISSRLGK